MTAEKFTECMGLLQGAFGAIQGDRFRALNVALSDLSDSQMEAATKTVFRTFRPTSACPFPVPADFTEAIGGTPEDKANAYMAAISKTIFKAGAYKSVSFGSDAVHSVISRFGGWTAICGWSQSEWNINEGRFLSALKSALAFDSGYSGGCCAGVFEQTNGFQRPSDLISVMVYPSGKIEHGKTADIENCNKADSEPLAKPEDIARIVGSVKFSGSNKQ